MDEVPCGGALLENSTKKEKVDKRKREVSRKTL